MEAIDADREKRYDKQSDKRHIYFYGDIDLTKKDDIDHIRNYNIIQADHLGMVYSNFDYESGTYEQSNIFNGVEYEPQSLWGPCIDPLLWFKYNHVLLGKPNKVVVRNASYDELRFFQY